MALGVRKDATEEGPAVEPRAESRELGTSNLEPKIIVIALMYHDIVAAGAEDTSGFPGRDAALYKVTPEQFEAHLDAIVHALPNPPALAITFDDGGISALNAADALERRGWRGHFFVTTDYIGTRGFLDSAGIRDLHQRGHIIGSHSCSHPLRLGHCSWPKLVDEWAGSHAKLSTIVGAPVPMASVPGGDFAPQVAEVAARAGFNELFTSEPTTSVRQIFGLTLRGRFTIRCWTSPATAAGLARGTWIPCTGQALLWSVKRTAKRVGGPAYLRFRKRVLGHGTEVQWGDLT
jgi:peptidoglycan/xylan/chitin deacetylase (PgdA/CDA1 family)